MKTELKDTEGLKDQGTKGLKDHPNGRRMFVAIDLVAADPEQPRKHFDSQALKDLAESIKEQGIVQDLIVKEVDRSARNLQWIIEPCRHSGKDGWHALDRRRLKDKKYEGEQPRLCETEKEAQASIPMYEIVDGERRWRAGKLAGLTTVPVAVREVGDQARIVQLIANQQRENLSALEEAEAYRRELDAGTKPEDLAKRLGVSRATVFARLRLAELDATTRKALEAGTITASVAGLVAMVPVESRKEFLQEVGGNQYREAASFRNAQEEVEHFVKQLPEAGFDRRKDYGPGKEIVSVVCETCPKRSGNMEASGLKGPNVCTGPVCYAEKTKRHSAEVLAEAKAKGLEVLKESPFDDRGTLSYNSPWVGLANRCDGLGYEYKNHWKAALGDKCPAVVVAIDGNGRAHELVKKAAAMEALKHTDAWKKAARKDSSVGRDERWKKQEAKQRAAEKKRVAECDAINAAIVAKVEQLQFSEHEWLWRALVECAVDRAGFYIMKPIEKRRGWSSKDFKGSQEQEMAKMSLAQVVALGAEVAASSEEWQNEIAKALKVDVEKVGQLKDEKTKMKPPRHGGTELEDKITKTKRPKDQKTKGPKTKRTKSKSKTKRGGGK